MRATAIIVTALLCTIATHARALEPIATEDEARERARALHPYINGNDPGPLWALFDEKMRADLGDSLRFAAMLETITTNAGRIEEVLDEKVARRGELFFYSARCRFDKAPSAVRLNIAFSPDGKVAGLNVQPDTTPYPSTKLDYEQTVELSLPFRETWYVFWGGRTVEQNYHVVVKSQRFAIDFIVVEDGSTHTGEGAALTDYYSYGQEVLAPAPGEVVEVVDTHPDQAIGGRDQKNPFGNVVVIDHGNHEHSVLAHLRPGSVSVAVGDRVERGQVIGSCGNSGNTAEPHLHYQLQAGPDRVEAEGLPVRFTNLLVDGERVDSAELVRGQSVAP